MTRAAVLVAAAVAGACLMWTGPAFAQGNVRECTLTGSEGTKQFYTCRYGPVTVAPYQVLSSEFNFDVPTPKVDGHITAMETDVVDANGTPVPINRLMLHHIVFANLGAQIGTKHDRTCDSFLRWDSVNTIPALAERFYAAGEERAKLRLPSGYGYRMTKRDGWTLTYMFMNHRNRVDSAFIQYKITVDTAPNMIDVTPYWLDVENCKIDPVYDVPGHRKRGATSTKTAKWTIPQAGRIVAAGGHVHGGGMELRLRRDECGRKGSTLYESKPTWGKPSHPFYHVRPILHEPGPIHMGGFNSARGFPVAAGERIALDSIYDATRPHTRVMGIMLVYVAPDASVTSKCGPRPDDVTELPGPAGRKKPPPFTVPIVGIRGGRAVNIAAPRGRRVRLGKRGTITVGDQFFRRPNVTVRKGSTLTWDFEGSTLHNITVANGPQGFSSPNLNDGRTFKAKLNKPGTYQLFCGLHPVAMTATIKVTGAKKKRRH
ncbi:MAG TPA: plastocyanin/azurin family copper-binding protein [Thermoleophilaceae bacterium]